MAEPSANKAADDILLRLTAEVVAAYVRKNPVAASQLGEVIDSVYGSLRSLESKGETRQEPQKPAVTVRKSITPDYLICLEDGKKLKMLKRHLRTTYALTPDAYRQKWGLPPDYPMVAPNYAQARSAFAKRIGLGRGGRPPAGKRGRKKSAE
ncbi:MAG TPA: MucR family transcriptional regulator [Stellaceae bacterium]|jgi:predicted transcriptional regulator|nr:MucR family transcriptional regulator [Stellaceae bacterium]